MSETNVDPLLAEVSPDAPCGPNLEYDPEYMELMRAAQFKAGVEIGDMVVAAEEPNWRDVRKRSADLFGRTKDLVVALRLCEALLRLEGLPGLRDGLAVMHGLLARHWEPVHPQLDPSDGNDPTVRLNVLVGLTDPQHFLTALRAVPLTRSPVGRYSLREIAWATGRAPAPEDVTPPTPDVIEAAFKATPPDELAALAQAAQDAIEAIQGIDGTLSQHLGAGRWVDFEPLVKVLQEILTELRRRLPAGSGGGRMTAGGDDESAGGQTGTNGHGAAAAAGRGLSSDGIHDAAGVVAAIDQICDYYARYEPSSPVPLLLNRAKKLVGKGFLDIVRDLSPEALAHVQALGGVSDPA